MFFLLLEFYLFSSCCMVFSVLSHVQDPLPFIYVNSTVGVNSTACWEGGKVKPCLTLDLGIQGIHTNRQGTLTIAPGTYALMHSNFTDFHGMNDVSIQGVVDSSGSQEPPVVVKCSKGVGLSFVKVNSLSIGGITFSGCGALRNSTSYNMNNKYQAFIKFYVGIYFLYCKDLNITFIKVLDTPGTGMVIYNTVGTNLIHNSTFVRNMYQPNSNYSGGGGLYIEFSFCDGTNLDCLRNNETGIEPGFNEDSTYLISNSYFVENYASLSEAYVNVDSFILPIGRNHVAMGRGGGLSFHIIGTAKRNRFTLTDCVVANNIADWGAGILVEFHDCASGNSFEVAGSKFLNNSLNFPGRGTGTGGGGARLAMFAFAEDDSVINNNTVTFHNCTFEENKAYYGGGFSFYTSKVHSSNALNLSLCNFTNNKARLGAGLDVSLLHTSVDSDTPKLVIEDCEFHSNQAFNKNLTGSFIGTGTVYVDTIPVVFSGLTLLEDNLGTALTITDTHITMLGNSTMRFVNNTGRYSGALSVLGNSYIVTTSNCSLEFIGNSAGFLGGAIYYYSSGERDLVGSGNCFIRYSDVFLSRYEWDVLFYFEDNVANGVANAIYASTVLPCIHGGKDWDTNTGTNRTFCWNDRWVYDNRSDEAACQEQIMTAPNSYSILPVYDKVIPGKMFNLGVNASDDYGNVINGPTLFVLKIISDSSNSASFKYNKSVNYDIISSGDVILYGNPNSTITIQIDTIDPIMIQDEFDVHFQYCPPGFHVPSTSNVSTPRCECAGNFSGLVRCHVDEFHSFIIRTVWMGKVPGHEGVLVGGSPYISDISDLTYIRLPSNISELEGFFCNQSNSLGVLCGKCRKGYGVSVASFESFGVPCVECPPSASYINWFYYFCSCFVPIVIFFLVVFVFSVSVTSGPLNSFIFFAQVVNSVTKINADGMIPLHGAVVQVHTFYGLVYDIWNLQFFDRWLHFCLSPQLNTLDVLMLGYARALFPLLLLAVVFLVIYLYNRGMNCIVCVCRPFHRCLARFRQFSNVRKSVIGGIAAFITISYTQITLISLLVVTPTPLYNADGDTVQYVFYYDGSMSYNWKSFRLYVAPAIVFTIIFVLVPPFLFGYPTLLKLVSCLSCHKVNLEKFYPSPKVQALLDEFHGCYKDGSKGGSDCRWFSSLYFIFRIALVSMYTATGTWQFQYTLQICFFLFVAFLFAAFRPYRKDWINTIDIGVFLVLAGICTISLCNLISVRVGIAASAEAVIIQEFLMGLPLVYCIVYCCVLLWQYIVQPYLTGRRNRFKLKQLIKTEISEDLTDAEDSRYTPTSMLDDSTNVPNFLEFIEESGRSSNSRHTLSCSQIPVPITTSINNSTDPKNESAHLLIRNNNSNTSTSESSSVVNHLKSLPRYKRRNRANPHDPSLPYGATTH